MAKKDIIIGLPFDPEDIIKQFILEIRRYSRENNNRLVTLEFCQTLKFTFEKLRIEDILGRNLTVEMEILPIGNHERCITIFDSVIQLEPSIITNKEIPENITEDHRYLIMYFKD